MRASSPAYESPALPHSLREKERGPTETAASASRSATAKPISALCRSCAELPSARHTKKQMSELGRTALAIHRSIEQYGNGGEALWSLSVKILGVRGWQVQGIEAVRIWDSWDHARSVHECAWGVVIKKWGDKERSGTAFDRPSTRREIDFGGSEVSGSRHTGLCALSSSRVDKQQDPSPLLIRWLCLCYQVERYPGSWKPSTSQVVAEG